MVRRFPVVVFALLASVFGLVGVRAEQAAAQDDASGLIGDTATVVVVDPAGSAITVTHTYTFTNTAAEQVFSGFFETLPIDAREVSASSGGIALTAVNIPDGAGFSEWLVNFAGPLVPGETVDVELSWRLTGLAGGFDTLDLVTPGFVAIDPYPAGHRGTSSLEVVVPGVWQVASAEGYAATSAGGALVLTAAAANADEYVALPLVLEAPDRFDRTVIEAGPVEITVATAVGDASWLGEDLTPLAEGLAEWIPLDAPTDLVFRQGYTGDADLVRDGDVLVLPLDPSPVIAARAVAVSWLERMPFVDTALRDDLASALADRVARGEGLVAPPNPDTWSDATAALVAVSDEATMRTIIAALNSGVPAYAGADDTFTDAPVDWRRFTDVAQHLAGIDSAGDAMRLSATAEQLNELDRRAASLLDYRALEGRAAPWLLPPLLREAMAGWDFDRFLLAQSAVSDLVSARDEMTAAAAEVELEIGDELQRSFESAAESMDDAWTRFIQQREALGPVAEALRLDTGDRGLLSTLGMAGRDADGQRADIEAAWAAGRFTEAADAAEHLVDEYEGAVGRGTLRLLGPLALVLAVVISGQLLRRRRQVASSAARRAAAAQSAAE
ncbi:MAG: hypothetical protein AAGC53_15580 [Actinomycetota bacterium]